MILSREDHLKTVEESLDSHQKQNKQALLLRQKDETQSSYLTCSSLCPGNLSLLPKLFPLYHTL